MIETYRSTAKLSKDSLCFKCLLDSKLYKLAESQLSEEQHGFRKKHSTVGQLLVRIKRLFEALVSGEEVFTLYTDFCKTFDRVNFNLLSTKLRSFGIGGC